MRFWDNQENNPNCNILNKSNDIIPKIKNDGNNIHQDVNKILLKQRKNVVKYKKVSLSEAFAKQHACSQWVTTHKVETFDYDINERIIKTQKYSPFLQSFRKNLIEHQLQMNTLNTVNKNDNNIIKYKDKWIKVEALNKDLNKELTIKDRMQFYLMSIGMYDENKSIEIMEILDPCHPAKRDNINNPVFGLFAKEKIKKKSIIIEYCGILQTSNEYKKEVNNFEKFDGQYRSHGISYFCDNEFGNSFVINSSYYSNECVFVNDGTKDCIFGKWSKYNCSFFEIIINEMPHIFLRAFNDINPGDELLTEYGSQFWKKFSEDRIISYNLNEYYQCRKKRELSSSSFDEIEFYRQALKYQIQINKNQRKEHLKNLKEMRKYLNILEDEINSLEQENENVTYENNKLKKKLSQTDCFYDKFEITFRE